METGKNNNYDEEKSLKWILGRIRREKRNLWEKNECSRNAGPDSRKQRKKDLHGPTDHRIDKE